MCAKKTKDGSGVIERPDVSKQIADQFALFLDRYWKLEKDLENSIFDIDEDITAYELELLKRNEDDWVQQDVERFGGIQHFPNTEFLKIQVFQKHSDALRKQLEDARHMLLENSNDALKTGNLIRESKSLLTFMAYDLVEIFYCEKKGEFGFSEPHAKSFAREVAIEKLLNNFKALGLYIPCGELQIPMGMQSVPENHGLTDTEQNIIEALGGDTLTGAVLLKCAGYDNTSHYRTILSNLCKRDILGNNGKGYFKK